MKRVTRNILFTAGILFLAGFVLALGLNFRSIFPGSTTGPCFDEDYWDAKYENSLRAKLQADIKGIDVSHHQGNIDWKKVKKSRPNLAFVYVKCTEGKDYVDPRFKARRCRPRIQGGRLPLFPDDQQRA